MPFLRLINAAYTSQMDSFIFHLSNINCQLSTANQGLLMDTRRGDRVYRENGQVLQPYDNEARNIFVSGRWTHLKSDKSIWLTGTERYRLALFKQDASCTLTKST